MLKNTLIVVGMLVVFNAIFVFSGGMDKLLETEQKQTPPTKVSPDIVDIFRFTLEEEVRKKIGQPIEGYEPQMFLQAFPGLAETDFDGVQASIGYYSINNGKLVHNMDNATLVHSAAGAVTRAGIETLLYNIANRAGIDLQKDGTITDVMLVLTSQ